MAQWEQKQWSVVLDLGLIKIMVFKSKIHGGYKYSIGEYLSKITYQIEEEAKMESMKVAKSLLEHASVDLIKMLK
jgi:hypothetical protein